MYQDEKSAGAMLDRRTDYYDVLCGADDGEPVALYVTKICNV